jgi:hypothetical protein
MMVTWICSSPTSGTGDNSLFRNNGDGTFTKVTEGAVVNDGGRSWGCAWADYDNDGYLDLIVVNNGYDDGYAPPPEPIFLYRNNGGPNHWLVLRLVGVVSNRSAIGAKVRVLATIRGQTCWQMREICGGTWNQNDLRAHFGLGDAESAETVLIEWPSGVTQVLKNVAANQHLVVEEDPIPTVALSFSEGGGGATRDFGDRTGSGQIQPTDGYPKFWPNVPTGSWAPPNNVAAIDFGVIDEGQGGRAIDGRSDLGPLDAFTICGWLNARDLRTGEGGNRIVCALTAPDGPGFELVQRSDGSLQLGVNQGAEGSPVRSAVGRITEDAEASPANWVFFAVTYDGTEPTGNAQFFFGTGEEAAQPDGDAVDYARGVVPESGVLTVGNLSPNLARTGGYRTVGQPGLSRITGRDGALPSGPHRGGDPASAAGAGAAGGGVRAAGDRQDRGIGTGVRVGRGAAFPGPGAQRRGLGLLAASAWHDGSRWLSSEPASAVRSAARTAILPVVRSVTCSMDDGG